ncbi:MAG: hypothetical protein RIB58_05750 [Phycisphaerales bacterium]
MIVLRELCKNVATYAPTNLMETWCNYGVIRGSPVLGQPPEAMAGVVKTAYFDRIADSIGRDASLAYLEFGVWEGHSLRHWTKANTSPQSRFIGFDSFVGLPQQWRRRPAGYFSVQGQTPDIDDPRVSYQVGWFNKTLCPWLEGEGRKVLDGRTPVVHLDGDLFHSGLFVLGRLHSVLDRYHLLIDNYSGGEARSLHDYLTAYGASFEPRLARKRKRVSRVLGQVYGVVDTGRKRPEEPVGRIVAQVEAEVEAKAGSEAAGLTA